MTEPMPLQKKHLFAGITLASTLVPLAFGIASHRSFLETPRLNLQRAPFQSSTFLAPLQTRQHVFEASDNRLAQIELFMRPAPLISLDDDYTIWIRDLETGEERGPLAFAAWRLWDDVATIRFESFEDSKNHSFRLTVKTGASNRASVQLATPYDDSEGLIFQPYYKYSTPFFGATWIALERLSWRLLPLGLVIPLLMILVKRFEE